LVSETFDLKVADTHTQTNEHTNPQNSKSTDNKGRLKLSAREPTNRQAGRRLVRSLLTICDIGVCVSLHPWAYGDNK